MATSAVAGFSSRSGSSSGTVVTATLPTVADGDVALWSLSHNSDTTQASVPPGWTLVNGPLLLGYWTGWLFGRTLTAADSGTTVTSTLTEPRPWTTGGLVVRGATLPPGSQQVNTDTNSDRNLVLPGFTPASDDCLALALAAVRYAAGAVPGVTPPAEWTEHVDTGNTNTSGAVAGSWVASRQLTGQAGVAQPSATATYTNANATNAQWVVTLSPAPEEPSEWHRLDAGGVLTPVDVLAL